MKLGPALPPVAFAALLALAGCAARPAAPPPKAPASTTELTSADFVGTPHVEKAQPASRARVAKDTDDVGGSRRAGGPDRATGGFSGYK